MKKEDLILTLASIGSVLATGGSTAFIFRKTSSPLFKITDSEGNIIKDNCSVGKVISFISNECKGEKFINNTVTEFIKRDGTEGTIELSGYKDVYSNLKAGKALIIIGGICIVIAGIMLLKNYKKEKRREL